MNRFDRLIWSASAILGVLTLAFMVSFLMSGGAEGTADIVDHRQAHTVNYVASPRP